MTRARVTARLLDLALLAIFFGALVERLGPEAALSVLGRIVGVGLVVASVATALVSILVAVLVTRIIAAAAGDLDEVGW